MTKLGLCDICRLKDAIGVYGEHKIPTSSTRCNSCLDCVSPFVFKMLIEDYDATVENPSLRRLLKTEQKRLLEMADEFRTFIDGKYQYFHDWNSNRKKVSQSTDGDDK